MSKTTAKLAKAVEREEREALEALAKKVLADKLAEIRRAEADVTRKTDALREAEDRVEDLVDEYDELRELSMEELAEKGGIPITVELGDSAVGPVWTGTLVYTS